MATRGNVLEEARSLLEQRLKELDDEKKRLERAVAELSGLSSSSGGRPARRGPGRPRGSTNKSSGSGSGSTRRRRRRKGGTRADQAVKLVEDNPGISASEIAREMDIKPNYLYRVLSDLEKEGRLSKDGRSYRAKSSGSGTSGSSGSSGSSDRSASSTDSGVPADQATLAGTEGGGETSGPSGAGFNDENS